MEAEGEAPTPQSPKVFEEVRGRVICRLYYYRVPGTDLLKAFSPLEKRVYYVKSVEELGKICEKIFRKGYAEGRPLEVYTDKVTKASFARAVIYWLGRNNAEEDWADAELKKAVIELYLLPKLEECECSERTKKKFREVLEKYLDGEVTLRELVKFFAVREFRLRKGHHDHKIKIA
mgnify:CR=1 FL=1